MSDFMLSVDQHQIVLSNEGRLVSTPDNRHFLVYDKLSEDFIPIQNESMAITVAFLGEKEAFILENATVVPSTSTPSTSTPSNSSPVSSASEIWLKNSGKPTAVDILARDDFISLMKSEKFQNMLKDKKTTKKNVFAEVAKIMEEKGYSFGDRDGTKVCQQKWKNMENDTLKFLANAGPKNSGGRAIKKPEFFDDMFDVVKDTAKAFPKNIQDSLSDKGTQQGGEGRNKTDDVEEEEEEREQPATNSPFLKVKSSAKPARTNNAEILSFLKEDSAERKLQTEKLLNFFQQKAKKDNKRKKDLLEVLRTLAGGKKMKRKQASSSEDGSTSSDEET